MRSTLRTLFPVVLLALAPACGREVPSAEGAPAQTATVEDPRVLYGATAAENIRVVPVEIEVRDLPNGWNGMRIAALSDFQLGLWPDNEKVALAAVRKAVAAKPDVIVLLGDYVARGGDYTALDRVLAPLRGIPTFAVLGHTDEIDENEDIDSTRILSTQALQRNGVRVLRNGRAALGRNGDTAYIAGVEPYMARKLDWEQAAIYNTIPGGPRTPVLLAHFPAAAQYVPRGKYAAVLTGHTNCGRVEVPGTPRLTWVNTELFPGTPDPATRRIYLIRGNTMFITCGLGHSYVPVRFGAPPEIAMVTLRGFGSATRADSAATPANASAREDSLIQVYQRFDTAAADTTAPDSAP